MEVDNLLIGIIVLLLVILLFIRIQRPKASYRYAYTLRPVCQKTPTIGGLKIQSASEKPPIQMSKPSELAKKTQIPTQSNGDAEVQVPKKPSPFATKKLETSKKINAMWNTLKSEPDTDDTGRIQLKTTTDMTTPLGHVLARNCECTCFSGIPLAKHVMFERHTLR
jgi:hypothetical protein